MTLVEFVTARLDEDERVALAAAPGPWTANAECDEVLAVDGIHVADGFSLSGAQLRATVDHIARHDPASVLRDVAAKRMVVAAWASYDEATPYNERAALLVDGAKRAMACAIFAFAKTYADHPDYDESWRP